MTTYKEFLVQRGSELIDDIQNKIGTKHADAFECHDCGVNTYLIGEYYMVTDEVWKDAGLGKGKLCIGCLEARLGRELHGADFTSANCNSHMSVLHKPRSERMLDRLSRQWSF